MSLDFITSRRSIRKYTAQPVSDDQVMLALQGAMSAPSAGDEQPWHYVITRDRQKLMQIADFHPYGDMAAHAPVAILVCGDESLERHRGYWVQDCAAATTTLLLSFHALGLGAVWVGIYPVADRVAHFREIFSIPGHVTPFALVPCGYPVETKEPANRFNKGRVHLEKFSAP